MNRFVPLNHQGKRACINPSQIAYIEESEGNKFDPVTKVYMVTGKEFTLHLSYDDTLRLLGVL